MRPQNPTLKTLTRRTLLAEASLLGGGLLLPSSLRSQATAPVPPGGMRGVPAGTPMPQDGKNPYDYSGLSGPGFPVTAASRHGGWRSGSSGVAYSGDHPYPFPTLPWDPNYATGSAVSSGILPDLTPLIDVQVRDTRSEER